MPESILFSSVRIGTLEIANRFAVPPMGTNYATPEGAVTQRLIDYYTARARGGFGLIIVEFTAVDPQGRVLVGQNALWDDACIEGNKKLVDAVHAAGAKIAVQLAHGGRQTMSMLTGQELVAPSPLPCPTMQEVPRELTTEEVYQLVDKFVNGAVRAKAAGYDAVEIHGAHGYLLAEFMSGYSNKRVDEFGGKLSGRMKMPLEIVKGVKEKNGRDYPVIFRLSHEEGVPGGRDTLESRLVAKMMVAAGADAIHVAAGNYESLHLMAGGRDRKPAYNVEAAKEIKAAVGVPVIVAGRINDPYLAEDIVQSGKADLVALGRSSLADPEFPRKAFQGAWEDIAPCISCSQGCLGYLFTGRPITCLVNPFCGQESTLLAEPAGKTKKILVAGGGPAGLLAAWVAAKRGHKVTLCEKEKVLGGQLRVGAIPPSRGEITKAIRYYIEMAEKNGVELKMGVEVTPELVESLKPDAVIIATGSVPLRPAIKGIENPDLLFAAEVLEGKKPVGSRVLVLGGSLVGLETADFVSSYGRSVTVLDIVEDISAAIDPYSKPFMMQRFHDKKVVTMSGAKVVEITQGGVVYENDKGRQTLNGFDSIVLAMGYRAHNPLEEALAGKVADIQVIGDAVEARTAVEATAEAAKVACKI